MPAYFTDSFTTLDLETDEGTPTSTPVAGITDIEIVPQVTMERLYTADSTEIESQKQHSFQIPVTIGYMIWDPVVAEQWLGGDGSSANTWTDTNDPQKFALNADFVAEDGTTLTVDIGGITFEEMPLFSGSNGEWSSWNLEGTGETFNDVSTA